MRGDRFKPLVYDQMTPAQKTMTDHVLATRGSMNGPFNVLLRDPEMGDITQQLGAQIRFHSSVPAKLNELAIIMTLANLGTDFEFQAHSRLALRAGLSQGIPEALAAGNRPASMTTDEETAYNFCNELLTKHQVSDRAYAAALKLLTECGVVDLISAMGYYHLVGMALNVDRYPLPEGTKPVLKH
jgi:4-carboxymuconolactone decarboxylase